jgi:hypothetical protein
MLANVVVNVVVVAAEGVVGDVVRCMLNAEEDVVAVAGEDAGEDVVVVH